MKALFGALIVGVLALATPSFAAQAEPVLVAEAKTELININRATAEELMTLKVHRRGPREGDHQRPSVRA